ncbi:hypothetical protein PFICI_07786 [Pestalotiopsis fici W106-1]|uniref:Heterokaryon incompatibility domain-containing protein n=1 Tax=Pestalotiopsis fici (strain W106-1 / CGMCC3.15140) TaxID=1229662 RepID=W3X4G2_PESFW|nr:uncharacterized protein PFICI_07786 [Pestalotiopsis fici W106-1]ETS80257.1 hypothetical protein PFICI_07786 [Pestalotiopsis fici W106-1]
MDDSRTTFSYDDLDIAKDQKQVRLLKLLPSIDDADQIICTLEVADWASELHYAAISYVWGDPTIKRAILINGQQFNVTENLHSALWHIRKNNMLQPEGSGQPESLPLWVDAVCINQDSIEERNHQVPLMGSIYGSASRVIYWLGRKEDGILSGDAAIAAIHEMTEAAFHNGSNLDQDSLKKFLAAHKGLSVPVVPDLSIPNATTWDELPQVWQSIVETLLCEFWSRVWISKRLSCQFLKTPFGLPAVIVSQPGRGLYNSRNSWTF